MPSKVTSVIISGFSYSGSSAIFDFLRGRKGFVAFPGHEFRLFRADSGLNKVVKEINSSGRLSSQTLSGFVAFCQGRMPVHNKIDKHCNKFIATIEQHCPGLLGKLSTQFVDSVSAIQTTIPFAWSRSWRQKKLFGAASAFVEALLVDFATRQDASYVVLDQAVRPWTLHYRAYFPNPKIILVRRDPRDQFIDQYNKASSAEREVAAFMETLRQRCQKTDHILTKQPAGKSCFMALSFEDFVTSFEEKRGEILSFIGAEDIAKEDPELAARFDPAVSRKNIGLYKHSELQEAVSFIQNHYADLLPQPDRPLRP